MNENTITMNGRQVTIMAMPGTRLSTETSSSSWITELLSCPSPPGLIRPSSAGICPGTACCACAAPAKSAAAASSRTSRRRVPVLGILVSRPLDDLDDLHGNLSIAGFDQFTARNQAVVDRQLDRIVNPRR